MALLLLGSALFADDAKVMPTRVGRLYLSPSFVTGSQAFDKDGDRKDMGNTVRMFNIGGAIEYGIISWVTGAIQWIPGINVWSEIEPDTGSSKARIFDAGDIFLGAKLQILGKEAPVVTDKFRLSFGPGIKIPLPGPDGKKEAENMAKGDAFTAQSLDRHAFGLGLRSYFDYLVNDNFFINLYNEFIFYPIKKDLDKTGLVGYMTSESLKPADVTGKVDYGYDLTFELEPVFTYPMAQGLQFSAGLPVNYKTTPGDKIELSGSDAGLAYLEATGFNKGGDQTHILSLRPNVSFFFTGWVLPVDFKLAYFAPIWGKNSGAMHTVNLQIKAYFKI